jgi:hypothetical protein
MKGVISEYSRAAKELKKRALRLAGGQTQLALSPD